MKANRRFPVLSSADGPRRRTQALWRRLGRRLLLPGLVLLVALIASPYLTLWRLDRAVMSGAASSLAPLVDIDAVREEIRHRLNKDEASTIGEVSDAFIGWIEAGIRKDGARALEQSVTLGWLLQLLAARADAEGGLLGSVGYAFFDLPDGFLVRVGAEGDSVKLRMQPRPFGWRVTAVYY